MLNIQRQISMISCGVNFFFACEKCGKIIHFIHDTPVTCVHCSLALPSFQDLLLKKGRRLMFHKGVNPKEKESFTCPWDFTFNSQDFSCFHCAHWSDCELSKV
jgi:hypothetical protein